LPILGIGYSKLGTESYRPNRIRNKGQLYPESGDYSRGARCNPHISRDREDKDGPLTSSS